MSNTSTIPTGTIRNYPRWVCNLNVFIKVAIYGGIAGLIATFFLHVILFHAPALVPTALMVGAGALAGVCWEGLSRLFSKKKSDEDPDSE